ncbi:MAG: ABC transporter ATP-binding protein, partial [Desulfovibrio sp.]|nr:ABC transporter ATP-binding protein [Desulfovibrio sp.]
LDLHNTFTMTIVVVTHDLDSMFTIAQHVVALHAGELVFQGSVDALKASHNAFLQQFLARQPGERARPTLDY